MLERFKFAYNAFMGRAPTPKIYYGGSSIRLDRTRHRIQNERSIVNSIINRISVDAASIDIRHVKIDEDGNYVETIKDHLNRLFTVEANVDQTGRVMIQDLIYSMLDEGCVALMPTDTTEDPNYTDAYEVGEARVCKVVEWFPKEIIVEAYNENLGRKEQVRLQKRYTPIFENPFYAIMNEPNSTLQRLIRVLNQLDKMNEETVSGKMDLIIQLPYNVKTAAKMAIAEERRKNIEAQLTNSKYGVAYIDGTERVIQLNRPIENNLWNQAKELKEDLFNQMGFTMEILNGTADEKTMTNYYSRVIEPILTCIVEEIYRKWLSKTAQSQNQSVKFFRDPFRLIPVNQVAEMSDKLTRNEILTSNEVRTKIGMKPSDDPKANELRNSNINQSNEEISDRTKGLDEVLHSMELFHYGMPRRSGRYPYGSGDRPYQNGKITKEKTRDGITYSVKDSENKSMSELTTYDFGIENFDWELIADVDTAPEHRRKGLASSLVNQAYQDLDKNKGLYLFVKKDNLNAIKLYEKMNFDHVKTYRLKDGDYYIMAKGNADKDQLKKMNFG